MKGFVLLALALSFFLSCGVAYGKYVKVSNCKNESEICSYEYHAGVELAKGEKVSVSAKVDISCESVGVFNSELSARFCMKVRNSVVKKTSEDNNDDLVPVEKLDKWFCFAQSTSSGKVLGVFYGKGEEEWVVNFKRSIASAFQANYKGTAVTNETDSQSNHTSHYKLACICMCFMYLYPRVFSSV
ncbi:PREDICTED: uncharacterized protein LOC109582237 [Amphimedon queenslandica]|uniref:Vitellogenin domain-containing protein n=1 Tax=Amphimedon queenslandica TaxID=400682 RepID=A0AAN0J6U1_AMPQE|nr:PREDICTED: uncharacterized protein LOC109582237 [Amphimedon queenslandica]|eukprot:XP_019852446.1 PREDICTED: uncharacterized protein LOC109582237 [Amphimedon queenslandica]